MSTEDSMDLDFALSEILRERSPCCLLVPTSDPNDPDIIGPFYSFESARHWQAKLGKRHRCYLDATIRAMSTVETVIAIIQEDEDAPIHQQARAVLRRHFGNQVRKNGGDA
jgi:hypothetical protein